MHDRLTVDYDVHVLVGHAEKVVGLYDLEALVHHGCAVYSDFGSHPPSRMLERVLRAHLHEPRLLKREEWPPRGGQQDPSNLRRVPSLQALVDRRVLRVHRDQTVISAEGYHPVAAGDV